MIKQIPWSGTQQESGKRRMKNKLKSGMGKGEGGEGDSLRVECLNSEGSGSQSPEHRKRAYRKSRMTTGVVQRELQTEREKTSQTMQQNEIKNIKILERSLERRVYHAGLQKRQPLSWEEH
jgi:hypothetical protein